MCKATISVAALVGSWHCIAGRGVRKFVVTFRNEAEEVMLWSRCPFTHASATYDSFIDYKREKQKYDHVIQHG